MQSDKDKRKKIRFIDDDTRDPTEQEKDTRLRLSFLPKRPAVTSLQKRMLEMAGQDVPKVNKAKSKEDRESSSSSSDSEDEDYRRRRDTRRRVCTLYGTYCCC